MLLLVMFLLVMFLLVMFLLVMLKTPLYLNGPTTEYHKSLAVAELLFRHFERLPSILQILLPSLSLNDVMNIPGILTSKTSLSSLLVRYLWNFIQNRKFIIGQREIVNSFVML
jgi:hypothetical protein